MSDLISREEVLNLIDTAFESGAFDGRYAYENLIDAVQNLIHPLETDLVSRQAVIDTIETDCSWDIFNEWGSRTPTGECIINAIKSVPSVEPEQNLQPTCNQLATDCISRQAVLDLAKSGKLVSNGNYKSVCDAINGLPSVEYETDEDCISRERVLLEINRIGFDAFTSYDYYSYLYDFIDGLPSEEPERKTGKCKGCKYFEYDSMAKVDGIPLIVAHEICKRWGDGCKTSEDGYCFLYEPQEIEVDG